MKRCSLSLTALALVAASVTSAMAGSDKPRRTERKPAAARSAPAAPPGNINVPSTDFSTVEQAGSEPAERSRGGTMRPAITDGGSLGMGMGF